MATASSSSSRPNMDSETADEHQNFFEIRPLPPPPLLPGPPLQSLLLPAPPPGLPCQQPRLSVEISTAEELKVEKVPFPFFRPIRQRGDNIWVISLFVILHISVFMATMIVNDCWRNSHGQCTLRSLGRLSFQPLSENPLLGPSASALEEMGALRRSLLTEHHKLWLLFTSPWLHGGLFHLVINLSSVVFVGVHLEQEFGPLRIGTIYVLSAIMGSLVAALFLQDRPSVASSGALCGLLGTVLAGLIQNRKVYSKKFAAIVAFLIIFIFNLILGLMPYVNNFSSIGGLLAGCLLGFVLLSKPHLRKPAENKTGLFEYDAKRAARISYKVDKLLLRSAFLVIFSLLVAGFTAAVIYGINVNKYCSWCRYLDCVPSKWWSCSDQTTHCEAMETGEQLTLTCSGSGKFRVFPFTDLSQARLEDLCYLICS